MKKKDLDDLKIASIKELVHKVSDLEKRKINELLELKMGKTKNVHSTRAMRKELAKIKTILKMKLTTETSNLKTQKEAKPSVNINMAEVKSNAAG